MCNSRRRDRGALTALGLALVAIVFATWLSQPTYSQIRQGGAASNEDRQQTYGPIEGHWWPEFSARDTYAQWVAALASVASAVISIWAVRLVRDSLEQTRLSTIAAIDAAGYAKDAVSSDRAWVLNTGQMMYFDGDITQPRSPNQDVGFALRWKNHGRSPALKARMHITHSVQVKPEPVPEFPNPNLPQLNTGAVIGPEADTVSNMETIPWGVFNEVLGGTKFLFIHGYVEYEDIFTPNSIRVTEICARGRFRIIQENGQVRPTLIVSPAGPQNIAT